MGNRHIIVGYNVSLQVLRVAVLLPNVLWFIIIVGVISSISIFFLSVTLANLQNREFEQTLCNYIRN